MSSFWSSLSRGGRCHTGISSPLHFLDVRYRSMDRYLSIQIKCRHTYYNVFSPLLYSFHIYFIYHWSMVMVLRVTGLLMQVNAWNKKKIRKGKPNQDSAFFVFLTWFSAYFFFFDKFPTQDESDSNQLVRRPNTKLPTLQWFKGRACS